jgi:hypothetical protein
MADPNTGLLSQFWSDWLQKLWIRVGASSAQTNDEISARFPVQSVDIGAAQVTGTHLAASVAGNGLSGGAGSALAVNVDGSTITITGDALGVPDSGIPFAKLLSTDWTSSKAATGYTKLPNGIYIQWGAIASIASGTNTAQTFPVAFPAACFQVVAGITGNGAILTTTTGQWGVSSTSTTGFTLNNRTSSALTFNYVAVGA